MLSIHKYQEGDSRLMLEFICITLPALLWIPSYFFVLLFFEKLHAILTSKSNTLIRPFLTGSSWVIMIIYAWSLIQALSRSAYDNFAFTSSLIVVITYACSAFGIAFYGFNLISKVIVLLKLI